ncbi:heavy metal-responsive transcriptional regulator [Xanthomonas sp. XNM01]|uniref:heavy metal-responsive transcriptional regulator n=1 Tax=Xanthomonas sp. XNM01 TaxID=2769289 RepID=UPI001781466B|nr:heavy metal-responsive transcriptional regulator [Xanthomonas sp. XNM01]MBD9369179.1 heavy metal-responsive transcriptional regulator [Xanthomonas sp. XNM01]
MIIGQLARQAGVPIDTIRYYERQRLLPEPLRSASGYRRYGQDDLLRLNFIKRAKGLGFTLDEIRDLLGLSDARATDMASVKAAATGKLALVESRIEELGRVRDALQLLVDACPGHGALSECPIMAALSGEQEPTP